MVPMNLSGSLKKKKKTGHNVVRKLSNLKHLSSYVPISSFLFPYVTTFSFSLPSTHPPTPCQIMFLFKIEVRALDKMCQYSLNEI